MHSRVVFSPSLHNKEVLLVAIKYVGHLGSKALVILFGVLVGAHSEGRTVAEVMTTGRISEEGTEGWFMHRVCGTIGRASC